MRFGGGSYQSASDQRLHFGLGPARIVDRVEVTWPSGSRDCYQGLGADAGYRLREGDPAPKPSPASQPRRQGRENPSPLDWPAFTGVRSRYRDPLCRGNALTKSRARVAWLRDRPSHPSKAMR